MGPPRVLQMIINPRHALAGQHPAVGDVTRFQQLVEHGIERTLLGHDGAAAAALSLLLFGSDNMLIPAMLLIAVVLTLLRKREVPADG